MTERVDEDEYQRAVGDLVIQWGRLESVFPNPVHERDRNAPLVDLAAAARGTGVSERQLRQARKVRNDASHSKRSQPTMAELDEALGIMELVRRALGGRPSEPRSRIPVTGALRPTEATSHAVDAPSTYDNPRGDNPWDNDAVHWLLDKPDVAARFKRGPLMECLRRQPARVRKEPHRVDEAAELARRHGVIQRREFDPGTGKTLVRLYRTDDDRPRYPGTPPSEAAR